MEYILENEEYLFTNRLLEFVFMAVSGAIFFWDIGKFETLSELVRNKARRLLLPFLLVTTFISVPLKYASGYYAHSTHVLWDILCGQYLLLGNSHLWFVVSLFYIFVIFYCLEKYRIPKNWLYWCPLCGLSWSAIFLHLEKCLDFMV